MYHGSESADESDEEELSSRPSTLTPVSPSLT